MESFFYIGIAAYNEEKNIVSTLRCLEKSLEKINLINKPEIIICLNGCNDKTSVKVHRLKKKYKYKISILHSEKGKLKAHKTITNYCQKNIPILFLDADVYIQSKTIISLFDELKRNNFVKVVSSFPTIKNDFSKINFKNFLIRVLNFKRLHPKIEISKGNVSNYHLEKDDFLSKSRIYFHGRCFLLRHKDYYKFPNKNSKIRGDDSFLSFYLRHEFPKGSIKVIYDNPVYTEPVSSLKEYYLSWYRIRKDLDLIYKEYPEFKKIGKLAEMKFNWKYFLSDLSFQNKIISLFYYLIKLIEKYSFKIIRKKIDIDKIW
jgi:hypothetical protein